MQDLTLDSFAYLRVPLVMAGIAFLVGAVGTFRAAAGRAFLAAALMMIIFFHAARQAMVVFDPYLSSRPLATALEKAPEGTLITQGFYYQFSSVFYYSEVFIVDSEFPGVWTDPQRYYLLTFEADLPRYQAMVGSTQLSIVAASGGKLLLTNHPLTASTPLASRASSESD